LSGGGRTKVHATIRTRNPTRTGAGTEIARIVVLSQRSIRHPLAGGADRYIHEIFRRLTDRHSITILSSGGVLSKPIEEIDGIEYRHFPEAFHRIALPARYLTKFAGKTDLLIDNSDVGIPWLSPVYTRVPKILVTYQVARDIFRHELARPLSEIAVSLEPRIYSAYRNTKIVTCSPSTKDDLVSLGIQSERVSVIRPGIDDSFRGFEPDGLKFGDPTIICISRFQRYKGLSYAIRSMKFVLEKVPRARLVIVGNGDPTELKEEVSRTDYAGSIEILERVPNNWESEKRVLLSKSHLLLIPSIREGYGIVVIEANACGIPAIGWEVPGVQDSIIDGKTGLLVHFGDTRALAETIVSCLSAEPRKIAELSKAAVEWARQHSWSRSAEEFELVIQTRLAGL
jgi:glycosyltransferase involved in cell wall biosynthesis